MIPRTLQKTRDPKNSVHIFHASLTMKKQYYCWNSTRPQFKLLSSVTSWLWKVTEYDSSSTIPLTKVGVLMTLKFRLFFFFVFDVTGSNIAILYYWHKTRRHPTWCNTMNRKMANDCSILTHKSVHHWFYSLRSMIRCTLDE